MNKKIKLGLIGAGNIMSTRHLPALLPFKDEIEIVGIIDTNYKKAESLAKKFNIKNFSAYEKYSDLSSIDWFKQIDAVLIATPPHDHASMIDKCLSLEKHVLVEKPFVTDITVGERLILKAKKNNRVLMVNHNFQFSNSFQKLEKAIKSNYLGKISSLFLYQISNDQRRLPKWGDNLPLGLFYDESPHFFYLIKKFLGKDLKVNNVYKINSLKNKNTPKILDVQMESNKIPISMYLNFEGPICEWYFCVIGISKIAIVDLFRDIIIILPNDGQHLSLEVFKTSFLCTIQHWFGFIVNGWLYSRNKLFYGMDTCHMAFINAIRDKKNIKGMSAEDGLWVNQMQYEIVKMAE